MLYKEIIAWEDGLMFTASSCIYNIGEDESMPARDPAGVKMTRGLLHAMWKGVSAVEINSITKKEPTNKKRTSTWSSFFTWYSSKIMQIDLQQ